MIQVITGGMFAGKTELLLLCLEHWNARGKRTVMVRPLIDHRETVTHGGVEYKALAIDPKCTKALSKLIARYDVIGIDEGQFFSEEIYQMIKRVAQTRPGKRFIISGLDMDSEGQPFGIMPYLMTIADAITKLHAMCASCQRKANISFCLSEKKEQVKVGGRDTYRPLCWRCYAEWSRRKRANERR